MAAHWNFSPTSSSTVQTLVSFTSRQQPLITQHSSISVPIFPVNHQPASFLRANSANTRFAWSWRNSTQKASRRSLDEHEDREGWRRCSRCPPKDRTGFSREEGPWIKNSLRKRFAHAWSDGSQLSSPARWETCLG